MAAPKTTLRKELLRFLLVPLSVLFLFDAAGSYLIAVRMAEERVRSGTG